MRRTLTALLKKGNLISKTIDLGQQYFKDDTQMTTSTFEKAIQYTKKNPAPQGWHWEILDDRGFKADLSHRFFTNTVNFREVK